MSLWPFAFMVNSSITFPIGGERGKKREEIHGRGGSACLFLRSLLEANSRIKRGPMGKEKEGKRKERREKKRLAKRGEGRPGNTLPEARLAKDSRRVGGRKGKKKKKGRKGKNSITGLDRAEFRRTLRTCSALP